MIGVAGAGKEISTRPFQLVTGRSWKGARNAPRRRHPTALAHTARGSPNPKNPATPAPTAGTAFGGWKSRTHVPQLVRRVLSGELPVARYITHTFDGLEGTQAAIDALHSGGCLRAVVRYARAPGAGAGGAEARGAEAGVRLLSERSAGGGRQLRLSHASAELGCEMTFSVFLPPGDPPAGGWPALLFLSGLTCTDENAVQKAGFQAHAARLGLAVLCPDTSPRGAGVPGGETGDFALGAGASFYLDATQPPWAAHYRMESYLRDELIPLAAAAFGLDLGRLGVSGHSMGGHGALTLFLRNPGLFRSVSALAPICNPTLSPWGRRAFEAYLGSAQAGAAHDACELLRSYGGPRAPLLVDVGAADEFLKAELMPAALQAACAEAGHPLTLRTHAGYDHSYLFVASFIGDHLAHHMAQLGARAASAGA